MKHSYSLERRKNDAAARRTTLQEQLWGYKEDLLKTMTFVQRPGCPFEAKLCSKADEELVHVLKIQLEGRAVRFGLSKI